MWKAIKEAWHDYNSVQKEFSAMGLISIYSAYGAWTYWDYEVYQEWLKKQNDQSDTISEEN